MVNPREECKPVSLMIVEETPIKEEKVEAEPKASFIAPSPPSLLAENAPPFPTPKLKSEGKSVSPVIFDHDRIKAPIEQRFAAVRSSYRPLYVYHTCNPWVSHPPTPYPSSTFCSKLA
ncbi:hypothetical protein PIB30_088216 [Stylosanthes scabra]|uniref:Uncharacterized protein n=1 Tax=Stylosanthes scabra TaxID=79078 RepID=A0ABU6XSM1_9FABA|nr:hypothetical protein [Stylosanthes scabra]